MLLMVTLIVTLADEGKCGTHAVLLGKRGNRGTDSDKWNNFSDDDDDVSSGARQPGVGRLTGKIYFLWLFIGITANNVL